MQLEFVSRAHGIDCLNARKVPGGTSASSRKDPPQRPYQPMTGGNHRRMRTCSADYSACRVRCPHLATIWVLGDHVRHDVGLQNPTGQGGCVLRGGAAAYVGASKERVHEAATQRCRRHAAPRTSLSLASWRPVCRYGLRKRRGSTNPLQRDLPTPNRLTVPRNRRCFQKQRS